MVDANALRLAVSGLVVAVEAMRGPVRDAIDLCEKHAAHFPSPPRFDRDAHPFAVDLVKLRAHLGLLILRGGDPGVAADAARDRLRTAACRADAALKDSPNDAISALCDALTWSQRTVAINGNILSICDDGGVARERLILGLADAVRPFAPEVADTVRSVAPAFDGYPIVGVGFTSVNVGSDGEVEESVALNYTTGVLCSLRKINERVFDRLMASGPDALGDFIATTAAKYGDGACCADIETASDGVMDSKDFARLRAVALACARWVKRNGVTAADLMSRCSA